MHCSMMAGKLLCAVKQGPSGVLGYCSIGVSSHDCSECITVYSGLAVCAMQRFAVCTQASNTLDA